LYNQKPLTTPFDEMGRLTEVKKDRAHQLVHAATPKISITYFDYLKHIEKNKKFLKELKSVNKPF
jgi:hypothetical protein